MTIIFRSWLFEKRASNKIDNLKKHFVRLLKIDPTSAKQHQKVFRSAPK